MNSLVCLTDNLGIDQFLNCLFFLFFFFDLRLYCDFHLLKSGASCSENYKDLDVVSVHPEVSSSTRMDFTSGNFHNSKLKDQILINSRIRSTDDSALDYDCGIVNNAVSSSVFDFQKGERAPQKVPLAPFAKPAPSKWDDAQKWIASPTSTRPKHGQGNQGIGSQKPSYFGYGLKPSAKVVTEVPDQTVALYEEPDTKQIDSSHKKGNEMQKFVSWDSYSCSSESYSKPVPMFENCIGESASKTIFFLQFFISWKLFSSLQISTIIGPLFQKQIVIWI